MLHPMVFTSERRSPCVKLDERITLLMCSQITEFGPILLQESSTFLSDWLEDLFLTHSSSTDVLAMESGDSSQTDWRTSVMPSSSTDVLAIESGDSGQTGWRNSVMHSSSTYLRWSLETAARLVGGPLWCTLQVQMYLWWSLETAARLVGGTLWCTLQVQLQAAVSVSLEALGASLYRHRSQVFWRLWVRLPLPTGQIYEI